MRDRVTPARIAFAANGAHVGSMSFRQILSIGLAALPLAVASPSRAAGTTERIVAPISQLRLSDGTKRYSVPVRVGGRMIEAMLDTGSFGLRVMVNAIPSSHYQPMPLVRRFHFASGVVLEGMLAKADVAVGAATTESPVVIQIVQSVHCAVLKPHCPAAQLDAADYRLGGDGLPRQGFTAILGLSMRSPSAPSPALNPLSFIGDRRWIIVLPRPSDSAPGELIINPNQLDMKGFQMFPVSIQASVSDRQSLHEGEMPGCLGAGTLDQDECPRVPMDTGTPNALQPFFSYRVLYDQKNGLIGFKQRKQD